MRIKYIGLVIIILLFYSCAISSKEEISNKKYSLEEVKVINNDFLLILDSVIAKSQKCIFAQEDNPYFFSINFSGKDTLSIIINSAQYASFNCEIYFNKHNSRYCFYYRGILFVVSTSSNLSKVSIFEKCGREIYLYPMEYKDYVIKDYDYNNSIYMWVMYEYINNTFLLYREDLCNENLKDRKIKETKDKIIYR